MSSVENNLLAGLETLFVRAPSLAALADQDWTVDALVDAMNPRVSQPGRRSTVSKQLFPSLECDLPPKSLPHLLESSDSPGTSLFARLKLCHRVKFDIFDTFYVFVLADALLAKLDLHILLKYAFVTFPFATSYLMSLGGVTSPPAEHGLCFSVLLFLSDWLDCKSNSFSP